MILPLMALAAAAAPAPSAIPAPVMARIDRVLKATPLIDGHNDIAESLWGRKGRALWQVDIAHDLAGFHTDIARLKAGRVGGQFWSVYVDQAVRGPAAVEATLREIDIVRGLIERYPDDLALALTADDVERLHKASKVASLMGAEGGQQIDNSLPVLRQYYNLGVRYLTLAHSKNIDWAEFRHRRARPSRPDAVRPRGDRRDEPHRHAGRSQPCLAGRDAPGDRGQPRARHLLRIPARGR